MSHRRLTTQVKRSLREVGNQLSLLNHQIGAKVALRDVDLDLLDLLSQSGPLGPSALARTAGLHPATVTGILDRLERGGWVAREPDPDDRRAVRVRVLSERNAEMFRHYAGMSEAMDELCAGFDEEQLAAIAEFLQKVAAAGREATEDLAAG